MNVFTGADAQVGQDRSSIISVQHVSKSFGATRALSDVSLTIHEGQSHGLLGRNGAGKSTLVSILTGLVAPDAGSLTLHGQPAPGISDRSEWLSKVACVYQKSRLVPSLSVAENLFLNNARRNGMGAVSWRWIHEHARSLLAEWDLSDIDPRTEAGTLSIAQKRLVELARALSFGCRFVILDEPTAGLDGREVTGLLDKVKGLQAKGVTFLYISHHLEETYEICTEATVLRDGRTVLHRPVAGLSQAELVSAMVGEAQDAANEKRVSTIQPDKEVLKIKDLSYSYIVSNLDLQIRAGEVLGLAGLAGSGKAQVALCIAGLLKPTTGTISISGKQLRPGNVANAIENGVGYVGPDRHFDGFVVHESIANNATLTVFRQTAKAGFVDSGYVARYADDSIKQLSIKAASRHQPVSDLSGGNQQKVVFAKALATTPKLLVLVNPLAGVDVASNQILYQAVSEAAAKGCAVLIVSDDLDELSLCDSIQVIFKGRLTRRFENGWDSHSLISAIEGVEA